MTFLEPWTTNEKVPKEGTVREDGQCSLDINGSNQRFEGSNYLRLMMMTYFKAAFAGSKNVYYRTGNESTWMTLGTRTIPSVVSAPVFTPGAGSYAAGKTETLSTATSGATIRYTMDGTAPTTTVGTVYTGPITLNGTTTIKAIAYKSGMTASAVVSATYAMAGLPVDLTVTSVPAGSTTFKATNSITAGAGVSVNSGAKATFEAGNVIYLKPGFQATAGGTGNTFRAKINPQVQ